MSFFLTQTGSLEQMLFTAMIIAGAVLVAVVAWRGGR
jgi:hypothetical protein